MITTKRTFLVHLPAAFSLFCSGLWFLPWMIQPKVSLSYYLLAFAWFLVAWILMLWLLVLGFRERRRGTGEAVHFFSVWRSWADPT